MTAVWPGKERAIFPPSLQVQVYDARELTLYVSLSWISVNNTEVFIYRYIKNISHVTCVFVALIYILSQKITSAVFFPIFGLFVSFPVCHQTGVPDSSKNLEE